MRWVGARRAIGVVGCFSFSLCGLGGCTIIKNADDGANGGDGGAEPKGVDAAPLPDVTPLDDADGANDADAPTGPRTSDETCAKQTSCGSCSAAAGCGWCSEAHACLPIEGKLGACKNTVTDAAACVAEDPDAVPSAGTVATCGAHKSLEECTFDWNCGWCNDVCLPGTFLGPSSFTDKVPYCAPGKWTWWLPPWSTMEQRRNACAYKAGAQPHETVEGGQAFQFEHRNKIQHVIIVVQENHSMDNMFARTTIPDIERVPDEWLLFKGGHLLKDACAKAGDPGHQWPEMHHYWNKGKLDGFFTPPYGTAQASGYFAEDDHPFYTSIARNFATSDRYFASVLGGTWPNRDYLLMGTSDGVRSTGGGFPSPTSSTIWDEFTKIEVEHQKKVPWMPRPVWAKVAREQKAGPGLGNWIEEGSFGTRYNAALSPMKEHVLSWTDFMNRLSNYDKLSDSDGGGPVLPEVIFVEGGDGYDEHYPHSIHKGESYIAKIVKAAMSQQRFWSGAAIMITYDESGGYYDHVVPPNACPPDGQSKNADFDYLGFRVPFFLVSPFAKANYVSHQPHSHTSILRFLELLYALPAFTARDANSDALLDMFDFTSFGGKGPFPDGKVSASLVKDPYTLDETVNDCSTVTK
jgi:phospholipase C